MTTKDVKNINLDIDVCIKRLIKVLTESNEDSIFKARGLAEHYTRLLKEKEMLRAEYLRKKNLEYYHKKKKTIDK